MRGETRKLDLKKARFAQGRTTEERDIARPFPPENLQQGECDTDHRAASARAQRRGICGVYAREGRYSGREDLVQKGQGNLPGWAPDAQTYFERADAYSRRNGRVMTSAVVSLPQAFGGDQQRAVVEDMATVLYPRQPHVWAVHKPSETNLHVHMGWSNKLNDGIERTAAQHFRRFNPSAPSHGGAQVNAWYSGPREALRAMREAAMDVVNVHLQAAKQPPGYWLGTLWDMGSRREPEYHHRGAKHRDAERWQQVEARRTDTSRVRDREQQQAISAWLRRARELGLQASMSVQEKIQVIAHDLQERMERWQAGQGFTRESPEEARALARHQERNQFLTQTTYRRHVVYTRDHSRSGTGREAPWETPSEGRSLHLDDPRRERDSGGWER